MDRTSTAEADLIVTNGRVLTMDPANSRAEAVAVKDGGIVALGAAREIGALAGPGTTIVDAAGATVLPGFIEAHMHLYSGAVELGQLQLDGIHGFEALRDAVRAYAAAHPDAPLVTGTGADYLILGRPATRHDLDRILPDRPFAMAAPDHHTMWANTIALEAAGILRGRDLGPGNEIVMGADGLACGELREYEAFFPVMELAGRERLGLGLWTGAEPEPAPTPAERAADKAVLRRGLDWCARHGITSFHNMDGHRYTLDLLSEIEREGGLICRARIPFHYRSGSGLDRLEAASDMARDHRSEWLNSGLVKAFMDGVLDSWTAFLVEPYADRPDWRGEPLFTVADFTAFAIEADRRELQIAVHAIGDGAVRMVLDGFETARRVNGARDSRHRVEHVELAAAADIPRFADLGVIASMQPMHAPGTGGTSLEPTASRLGRARWPLAFPVRSLMQSGASVVFSSDWSVAPIDPILGIQAAMLRRPWAAGDPDHSVSLMEAIAAYTVAAAHAEFMEHRKGMLRPGFMADLVVLSGDIEACPTESLHELQALLTVCGGRITHRA